MSDRERQRHEWRARVDAAARGVQNVPMHSAGHYVYTGDRLVVHWFSWRMVDEAAAARRALDAALSAPKPWRKR